MNTVLSERGSLIIYLDKVRRQPFFPLSPFSLDLVLSLHHICTISPQVSHTRPEEITFRIIQKMKVGVLQPATVSVYEYYDRKPQTHTEWHSVEHTLQKMSYQVFNVDFHWCKPLYISFPLQEDIVWNSIIQRGKLDSYWGSAERMSAHVPKVNRVVSLWRQKPSIHPSTIYSPYPLRVTGGMLEPIPADVGREAGYTLDKSGANIQRQQPFTLTFIPTIFCLTFDSWRKPQ